MSIAELLTALTDLRTAIANDIRNSKGAGGTVPLPEDHPLVMEAARLGWQNATPPTIYTLMKSVEFAHSQISIEFFRDGDSDTARLMMAAMPANAGDAGASGNA